MKILDINDQEILEPNYSLGYLKDDQVFLKNHQAIQAVKEESHYEVIKTYPNGGKDLKKVIDIPAVKAADAWDEYEEIQRYILYTEEELKEINKPTPDEDRDAMLVDMDYRLTLLELGI